MYNYTNNVRNFIWERPFNFREEVNYHHYESMYILMYTVRTCVQYIQIVLIVCVCKVLNFNYSNTGLSEHFASVLAYTCMHKLISNLDYPHSQLSGHFWMVPASLDNQGCTIYIYIYI